MAYKATPSLIPFGPIGTNLYLLHVHEEEAANTSTGVIDLSALLGRISGTPIRGAIHRQDVYLISGTGTTVDPKMTCTNCTVTNYVVEENGTPGAHVSNTHTTPVPFYSDDGLATIASVVNGGVNNVIESFYYLELW